MLRTDDINTIRGNSFGVFDGMLISEAACNIIAAALDHVTEDALDSEQIIKQKEASWAHLARALRLASEDMARLVGPCTGEPPTLDKVLADPGKARDAAIARYTWTAAEAREAASSWYADWLERAEEEATPDA